MLACSCILNWLSDGAIDLAELRLEQIDIFLALKSEQGWCRVSIATIVAALRPFLRYAAERGHCTPRIAEGIERPCLFKDEALPVSEALHLDLADVDLDAGILRIRETKFYKTRLVPTGSDLTLILAHSRAERHPRSPNTPDASFFLTQRNQRISRASAEEAFKQIRKRAEVHRDDKGMARSSLDQYDQYLRRN